MKKFTAVLLTLLMLCALSACGSNDLPASDVDYDLTTYGSTVLFAQITQMTDNPQDYNGKTVRMEGSFNPYPVHQKDGSSQMRCSCIVWDNTKCCTAGLDFVLDGLTYPDGYPEAGKTIVIEGIFQEDSLFGIKRGVLTKASLLKSK